MRVVACVVSILLFGSATFAAAQSQTEGFDLLCISSESSGAVLKLSVFIYVNGAEITHVDAPRPNEFPLRAYVNALTWSDGRSEYEVDRMTGVLRVKPGNITYVCEKRGGRKF